MRAHLNKGRYALRLPGNFGFMVLSMALVLGIQGITAAQGLSVDPADLQDVMSTLRAPLATERATLHQTDEGYIRFLGAPPSGRFLTRQPGGKSLSAAALTQRAHNFVEDHAGAFGILSDVVSFQTLNTRSHLGKTYVRLDQVYNDVPVFGGQVVVQLDTDGLVINVLSDIMRDTRSLDRGNISVSPDVDAGQAQNKARSELAEKYNSYSPSDFSLIGETTLMIYRPSVLGLQGQTRLVWHLTLSGENAAQPVKEVVLVDAHSNQIVVQYSLIHNAKDRSVTDVQDGTTRLEGEPETGNREVDAAYDFLGDTYDFYFEHHDRDGIDDLGGTLFADVSIPNFPNASWNGFTMSFGVGFVTDDITGHELTHGVTQATSNLIYLGFSGAINESFSDIWGEFIDLTNDAGDDSEAAKWYMGEDVPPIFADIYGGAIRSMKDPTEFGDPDRLGSPLLANPNDLLFDGGGVHINSGIGNKLCYLLTDEEVIWTPPAGTPAEELPPVSLRSFNGETEIEGMSIDKVADLFYACQFLLSPSADYYDLYAALKTAAIDQGYTISERCNLAKAARAVEIVPPDETFGATNMKATPGISNDDNAPVIAVSWTNASGLCPSEGQLLRSETGFPTSIADGIELDPAITEPYLDRDVVRGVTYYYTLRIQSLNAGAGLQLLFASATAGMTPPAPLTEVFGTDFESEESSDVDLSFTQLMYSPIKVPNGDLEFVGLVEDSYELTTTQNVFALPIPREDADGSAVQIPLTSDGAVFIDLFSENRVFPFFGVPYSELVLSSKGYISPDFFTFFLNTPGWFEHFDSPRISFLFTHLNPETAGEIWGRFLNDRVVVTFVNVPETVIFGESMNGGSNTVQVELFYSGHIRMTYQQLSVSSVVVGLSEGDGAPVDPAELFPAENLISFPSQLDLSEGPLRNTLLDIEPVPVQEVSPGDTVFFTFSAIVPEGETRDIDFATPPPWDGPDTIEFTSTADGSGLFMWETSESDTGVYTLTLEAKYDNANPTDEPYAYQEVRIIVGEASAILPVASHLELGTYPLIAPGVGRPIENGVVDSTLPLVASYDYSHPLAGDYPEYDEGNTVLFWFRNNQLVNGLTNELIVPPTATRGGDKWMYRVVPVTRGNPYDPINYVAPIRGLEVASEVVMIESLPELLDVSSTAVVEGDIVIINGTRLSAPRAVTFNGVSAVHFYSLGDDAIQAEIPFMATYSSRDREHRDLDLDVAVETTDGSHSLVGAVVYLAPEQEEKQAGCAASSSGAASNVTGDLLLMALVAALVGLFSLGRRQSTQQQ
jgi:Zn-dependent metalloprotease